MGQKLLGQPRGGGEVDIENPLSVSHGGRHPGSVRQCADFVSTKCCNDPRYVVRRCHIARHDVHRSVARQRLR